MAIQIRCPRGIKLKEKSNVFEKSVEPTEPRRHCDDSHDGL